MSTNFNNGNQHGAAQFTSKNGHPESTEHKSRHQNAGQNQSKRG